MWKTHIAVFGPPGAGKTTLVAAAQRRGLLARDLEDGGSSFDSRRAFLLGRLAGEPCLFGAADQKRQDFPHGTKMVLLLPSVDLLCARIAERGGGFGKEGSSRALIVRGEHSERAARGLYDLVLTGSETPDEIIDILLLDLGS